MEKCIQFTMVKHFSSVLILLIRIIQSLKLNEEQTEYKLLFTWISSWGFHLSLRKKGSKPFQPKFLFFFSVFFYTFFLLSIFLFFIFNDIIITLEKVETNFSGERGKSA